MVYQPCVTSCRFYGLRATGQNIRYSRVNGALGPSKSIRYSAVRYSGVCLHIFYCNSAGLSYVVHYNGVRYSGVPLYWLASMLKTSEKASSIWANFSMEKFSVVAGNSVPRFSLTFLSIFVHILTSIEPITLICVIGKTFFSCRTDTNFGQR